MRELLIGKNDCGQRLDKFLQKAVRGLPPSLLYKSIRLKRIKRNGKRCDGADILQEGDVLSLYINDEFFTAPAEEYDFMQALPKLTVIYEDTNILLADKEPGLLVHEDSRQTADTLINRIRRYLYEKGEYRPDKEQSFAPALCNRIDRNTGGLVIAAKNAESLRVLNEKIRLREIRKFYLCLTEGKPQPEEGTLVHYLEKDGDQNKVFLSDRPTPRGKKIITHYRVIRSDGGHSLLEVELETGRSHQIRAQMAYIGHPLVGDKKYGAKEPAKYHALYSYKLRFAFKSSAGILDYLNGREFQAERVWFECGKISKYHTRDIGRF